MPCEMCGKEAPLKRAVIEGTKMRVCSDCLEYGEEVDEPSTSPTTTPSTAGGQGAGGGSGGVQGSSQQPKGSQDVYDDADEILAEDYGKIVRKAREKKDLTAEELSNEINEKRSVVAKTERGEHHPSDDLVGKLERFLDIELMVDPGGTTQRVSGGSSGSSSGVTLGDLIKDEMDEDED
ncbi:TIGR00270 family protein [Thermoplasmatales archaeon SW_10_69_26]|nr:MAG: TIGR00270 family protein [Thermoplasmatales archaeon SW_10_69_26]